MSEELKKEERIREILIELSDLSSADMERNLNVISKRYVGLNDPNLKASIYFADRAWDEARRELLEKVNKIIDGLIGDDLAYKYKEYEKFLSNMSSMEICNDAIGCNAFVIDKLKKQIRKKLEKELKP